MSYRVFVLREVDPAAGDHRRRWYREGAWRAFDSYEEADAYGYQCVRDDDRAVMYRVERR